MAALSIEGDKLVIVQPFIKEKAKGKQGFVQGQRYFPTMSFAILIKTGGDNMIKGLSGSGRE